MAQPIHPQASDGDAASGHLPPEDVVWVGTPSHVTNLGVYVLCILLSPLVVPIFYALYRWLQNRNHVYEVTTQRIRESSGIFSKQTDDLELYRIKDMRLEQPFFLRMFHAGNIRFMTSDRTSEDFVLRAVRPSEGPRDLMDRIRRHVEIRRDQKRVREVDMEVGQNFGDQA